MSFLFNDFLLKPVFNFLVFLYNTITRTDFGVAIITLTLLIRILFFPLTVKSLTAQKELAKLQPKIKELQEKYKNDKQQLGAATMAMYKEHGVNPLGGCLPLLVQLPVLFALFKALDNAFNPDSLGLLYGFITNPGAINQTSFGILDLSAKNRFLAVLAGFLQWLQTRLSQKNQKNEPQAQSSQFAQMNKQMLYFFPIMVIIISWNFPTGLVLYWVATTGFSIIEHAIVNRKMATARAL